MAVHEFAKSFDGVIHALRHRERSGLGQGQDRIVRLARQKGGHPLAARGKVSQAHQTFGFAQAQRGRLRVQPKGPAVSGEGVFEAPHTREQVALDAKAHGGLRVRGVGHRHQGEGLVQATRSRQQAR